MARNREPESDSELESTVVQADSGAAEEAQKSTCRSRSRSKSKRTAPARSGAEKREKKCKIVDEILKENPYFIEEMENETKILNIKIAQTELVLDFLRKKRLSAGEVVDCGGGGD